MSEKGIIFSAPMVRAMLDGRKTQTRRLAKVRRGLTLGEMVERGEKVADGYFATRDMLAAPAYSVGDRLYVRENFYQFGGPVAYAADGKPEFPRKMTPCIHMPRWASRMFLAVTDVQVQRLGHMTEADAIGEGIYCERMAGWTSDGQSWFASPKIAFHHLWDSLHTAPGTTWAGNPWVVAVSFDVQHGNIDRLAA